MGGLTVGGLTADHPDPARLAAFGQGALDRGEMAEVESHLAACESCCELLSTLPDDEFVDRLRASQKLPGWATAFWSDASVAATTQVASEATGFEVPSSFVLSDSKRSSKMVATIGTSGPSAPSTRELPLEQELSPELLNHPRYEIVRRLGAGGMGSVYLAHHRVMDRPVALKVIRGDLLDNAALVERFRREVKSAAHLALHPNIVAAYDAEQAGDSHFLVMEFVDGINLGDLVKSRGPLPYEAACDAIKQAAEGLEHAHQRGMVHRDIKPQNLMRTADGQIKILDFGLARLVSEVLPDLAAAAEENDEPQARSTAPDGGIKLTLTDMVLGSADYIAPEQALDPRSADIRADIYSLGCTLYHLLAGQPPFPEGNLSQKLAAHAERPPKPLSKLCPDAPRELVRIVYRMMAKDRSRRFQRPAEVAKVLARFCHRTAEPKQHDDELPERPHDTLSRVDAKTPLVKPSDVAVSRKGASLKVASPSSRLETQSGPPPWPIRYATYWRRRPLVKVASVLSLLVAVASTLTITLVRMNRGNLRTDAAAAYLSVASAPVAPQVPRAAPAANSLSSPSPGDTQSMTSRLKDATVYLKARIAGKTVPLGSGFVIEANGDRVIVVTNRHIAVPDPSKLLERTAPAGSKVELEAVFHSGEGRQLEQALPAEIIAVDTSDDLGAELAADLAFLVVKGVSHPPQPVNPHANVEPREGMPYSGAGFPPVGKFGEATESYANPSATIANGDIAAVSRDDHGQLIHVKVKDVKDSQLPYDSGGPIVEEKTGRLIGVVARSGQTIISVVPAEEVRRCLAGRVGAVQLKWLGTSLTTAVEIKAQVVDPKRLVKSVLVRVSPAAGAGSLAPDGEGSWPPLPNASPVELQMDEKTRTASGKVQVSLSGQDAAGRVILIQPAHRNGIGQVIYSKPIEFQPPEEEGPIIASSSPERRPSTVSRKPVGEPEPADPPKREAVSDMRPAVALAANDAKPARSPEPNRFDFGPRVRRPVRVKEKLDQILASPRSHAAKVIIPAGMYELARSRYDRPVGPRKYSATERKFESPSSRPGAKFYLISGATNDLELEPKLAEHLDALGPEQLEKKPAILTLVVTESGKCGLVAVAILQNTYPRLRGGMVPDIVYETLTVSADGPKPAIGDDRDWESERVFKLAKYYKGLLRAQKPMWENLQMNQVQAQMSNIWANVMREAAAQSAQQRALQPGVGGR